MNESFQAKEGLPPDLFPAAVPTYTGHYHKPHVVANTNIQYVGSPYQGLQPSLLIEGTCVAYKITVLSASQVPASGNDCCCYKRRHNLLPAYNTGHVHHWLMGIMKLHCTPCVACMA